MLHYHVYIMANKWNTTLYIGMTNDIVRRVWEHKSRSDPGSFTARYRVDRLVWMEEYNDVLVAIAREKELKKWRRSWKNDLIASENPTWADLAADWHGNEVE